MISAFKMLGRCLTTLLLAVLASQPLAAESEEPVWFWMEECGGPQIRLELEFDGMVVQDATFPICRRLRSARPANQAKMLQISFAPPRAILWRGYKEVPETSPANQPLEFQIWEAGADPEDMILGVAVVANDTIYMNTLAISLPGEPFESRLAAGVVLRSIPVPGSRKQRGMTPDNSFERTRSAVVARFAARRVWRAAELMIR